MKDLIRRLLPDSINDIIALVALFRPGPLQSGAVDDYINRKHGKEPFPSPHPSLDTVLEGTYGVVLYQEQVMQIAQVLAGLASVRPTCCAEPWVRRKPKKWQRYELSSCRGQQKGDRRRPGERNFRSDGKICWLRVQQITFGHLRFA